LVAGIIAKLGGSPDPVRFGLTVGKIALVLFVVMSLGYLKWAETGH
jgi:hypothetical protein